MIRTPGRTKHRSRDRSFTPPQYSETEASDRDYATFPQPSRPLPRELRRSNAFHSSVPSTYRVHSNSESASSQESNDRQIHRGREGGVRGGVTWWQEGRSASDHIDVNERATNRRSSRYQPYDEYSSTPSHSRYEPKPGDRPRRSERPPPQPEAPLSHHRRRPQESREDGGNFEAEPKPPRSASTASPPAEDRDKAKLFAMFEKYMATLPEEERSKICQQAGAVGDQYASERTTKRSSTSPAKVPAVEVVGLVPASITEKDDNTDDYLQT